MKARMADLETGIWSCLSRDVEEMPSREAPTVEGERLAPALTVSERTPVAPFSRASS